MKSEKEVQRDVSWAAQKFKLFPFACCPSTFSFRALMRPFSKFKQTSILCSRMSYWISGMLWQRLCSTAKPPILPLLRSSASWLTALG